MGQPWKERWSLQQRDAGLGAGFVRGLIPDAGLDLADVGTAQQQHAQVYPDLTPKERENVVSCL